MDSNHPSIVTNDEGSDPVIQLVRRSSRISRMSRGSKRLSVSSKLSKRIQDIMKQDGSFNKAEEKGDQSKEVVADFDFDDDTKVIFKPAKRIMFNNLTEFAQKQFQSKSSKPSALRVYTYDESKLMPSSTDNFHPNLSINATAMMNRANFEMGSEQFDVPQFRFSPRATFSYVEPPRRVKDKPTIRYIENPSKSS